MLGDSSSRVLLNVFGYLWPSYFTFKALEGADGKAVESWCIYWLILAIFTTAERLVLDWTIFWLPLYYEGKFLFVLWLWHSHTQGAQYLYKTVLRPLLKKYEPTIDDTLAETQIWVIDNLWQYAQRAIKVVQGNAHLLLGQLQGSKASQRTGAARPPRAQSTSSEGLGHTERMAPGYHSRSGSGMESPVRSRSGQVPLGHRSPSPKRD